MCNSNLENSKKEILEAVKHIEKQYNLQEVEKKTLIGYTEMIMNDLFFPLKEFVWYIEDIKVSVMAHDEEESIDKIKRLHYAPGISNQQLILHKDK